MKIQNTALMIAASALIASSADAATITYDFNGGSAAGVSDFGSGVTADNVALGGLMQLAENRAHRKLEGGKIGTLAITVNIPNTVVVDLTSLDFIDGADSGTGSNDTFSQWDLAVSTGSVSPDSGTDFVAGTGFSSSPNSITLTGLTGLTDTSVTFTWTVHYGTVNGDPPTSGNNSNRHAFLDDIVFTGNVIPEPSSLALLGLGGLLIARRRRG
jgi:hypothetical protein